MSSSTGQPIYLAAHLVEAQLVTDFLAAHGVRVSQRGTFAWGAQGEIPLAESYPRLFLEDEQDRPRALALLRDYEQGTGGRPHRCAACGESSPGEFAVCWNCGAALAGR